MIVNQHCYLANRTFDWRSTRRVHEISDVEYLDIRTLLATYRVLGLAALRRSRVVGTVEQVLCRQCLQKRKVA